jgi:two-component system phosphate regulon sensor histidine kinase PhoR
VLSSQLKLMAALSALVLLVVLLSGAYAERRLQQREIARIAGSLEDEAHLVRQLAAGVAFRAGNAAELDAIADRAQPAAGARITLIDRSGAVVGDSNVPVAKLSALENHAERPEVAAALAGEIGTSTRRSETVGRRLFYLAIPVNGPDGGVVRLAVDLSQVDAAVAELREDLLVAGAVGLVAALAFSYALAWYTLRPLREVQRAAASIAGGDLDSRVTLRSIDELGGISTAINDMAAQIRQRLADITHEKEQLQAVLNGMVEGVLVVDARGRLLLANARMREFYAISGDVAGRSPLEVVRDAEVDSLLGDAGRTDEAISRRIVGIGAERRIFRVHAVRFPANGGPRTGTVAVFHDVTEVARLEVVRRDFVANASHELRTPVAAIRGFAETLRDSDSLSESDRASYLDVIHRHATRLGNLVGDLLELSKIEGRRDASEPTRVDVAAVAEALIIDSGPLFEERGISVELQVTPPAVAWARRQDVEQVLSNLVSNAVNYTDPGGRIEIRVASDAQRVRFSVADTGIGISADDQERIFERFYRVDATRSRAVGGTGLGLSIVKHLVLGMDGEISVESGPGRGSTFTVSLPTARSHAV